MMSTQEIIAAKQKVMADYLYKELTSLAKKKDFKHRLSLKKAAKNMADTIIVKSRALPHVQTDDDLNALLTPEYSIALCQFAMAALLNEIGKRLVEAAA